MFICVHSPVNFDSRYTLTDCGNIWLRATFKSPEHLNHSSMIVSFDEDFTAVARKHLLFFQVSFKAFRQASSKIFCAFEHIAWKGVSATRAL